MKLKNIIMSAVLLAGCLNASAQQSQTAEETREVFVPHWYVQGQVGGQYTLGEVDFCDLISGNAQIAGGYNFTPVWGLRLAVNAWQSKGGTNLDYLGYGDETWKYNYIAPTVDVTCDLANWILGYNANRVCNFGLLAGIGANIGWNNDEAASLKSKILTNAMQDPAHQMGVLWNDAKARFVGKFGAYVDFNVSRRVALGLEVNCNATSDHYNSKRAGNADWYFNALAGVKVKLGKVSKKVPVAPVIKDVVVKADEKPADKETIVDVVTNHNKPEAQPREPLRRDIFFAIRSSKISRTEMVKIEDVVEYLNKYPDARVSVTGYADKGIGNAKINAGYAQKRAEAIAKLLTCKYGISHLRICMDSKGDTVQPYEQNDLNRVTICIAE
ncbi:MAG: OmpA family protein [Bacteroidaceae bacterium]|nr:OmpA family protein [Bacteroidaceae bacterium]